MDYYSYLWLRASDGSPYYAGKGSGRRAVKGYHGVHRPSDKSRILIFPMLNEAEAFASEVALIELFGRKDLGTGCLRNRTNGGEGTSGHHHNSTSCAAISASLLGNKRGVGNTNRVGHHASLETRKKQSMAKMGGKNGFGNPANAARQAARNRGTHHPPETHRKMWDTRFIKTVAWG